MPLAEFFTGFRETALRPGELVTAIAFPVLGPSRRGLFVKARQPRAHRRSRSSTSPSSCTSTATARQRRRGSALGSVAPIVVRVATAEAALVGTAARPTHVAAAARAAAPRCEPIDDVRATAAYRRASSSPMVVERGAARAAPTARERRGGRRDAALCVGDRPAHHRRRESARRRSRRRRSRPTVNGRSVTAGGAAGRTLLDWLRDRAPALLTGTKEGCAEGECGACTVHLDGARRARLPRAGAAGRTARGSRTIEGLADGDGLHPLQRAFVEHGAVQCGYCIPGFLMAGAALLDESPTRRVTDVQRGPRREPVPLHRLLRDLRRRRTRRDDGGGRPMSDRRAGAARRRRRQGDRRGHFPADLCPPDALHAKVVFTDQPHARLLALDVGAAQAVDGVVAVLTAADVPVNEYGLTLFDQPVFVGLGRRPVGGT